MNATIRLTRGPKVNIPQLKDGEPCLCTDTAEIFIGNNGENIKIGEMMSPKSGGGGPMFQQMRLPPSSIYNSPTAWENKVESFYPGLHINRVIQRIVGDSLWIINPYNMCAIEYNLITQTYGAPVGTIASTGGIGDSSYAYVNGSDIIFGNVTWIYNLSSGGYYDPRLVGPYCLNIVSQTITPLSPLQSQGFFNKCLNSTFGRLTSSIAFHPTETRHIHFSHYYDSESRKILFFGCYSETVFRTIYDIATNTYGNEITNTASGFPAYAKIFFQKKPDGYIYALGVSSPGRNSKSEIVKFRLNEFNTPTNVAAPVAKVDFKMANLYYIQCTQYGDKARIVESGRQYIIDFETMTTDFNQFPNNPTTVYNGYDSHNNCFYYMDSNGLWRLPYYDKPLENAPVVCKIFKGQKFNGLSELEIPNKAHITTLQQVATNDITIKLGDYSAISEYTIYVESGNQ